MASARTADTGAEIRPVELWVDNNGVPTRMIGALAGSIDGASPNSLMTFWNLPLVYNGASWDRPRVPARLVNIAAQAITAGTPLTVWTPATGKKFRVLAFALSLSVAGSVILKYGAANTEFLRTPTVAAGTGHTSPDLGMVGMPGAANDVLKIDVTATGSVSGYVLGTEES